MVNNLRPSTIYINTVKSVNAVNYYLYESYRNEKGQSRSRIVEKLGNVDEIKRKFNVTDVDAWCKEYAKQRTEEAKKASLKNNRKLTVVFEEGRTSLLTVRSLMQVTLSWILYTTVSV